MFPFLFLLIHLIEYSSGNNENNVDTLHFVNACLNQTNQVELNLRCSVYEHIEIIRIIYGHSKQSTNLQCQFSIYDCIQEGEHQFILSCNGRQNCSINLSKDDIYSSAISDEDKAPCTKLNYVQVNFGCVPDAKDICDRWREKGSIIHISHIESNNQQYRQCQCKVRSMLSDGQVLLHAKDIARQSDRSNEFPSRRSSSTDCKKTTFLEIATDRSERKCMDNLPSHGNALFGSGSHNFTLTYMRNDPLTELFFYFELKASPLKKDHMVEIVCNWERRVTTTTHSPLLLRRNRNRKSTTVSLVKAGRSSRLDLIRHRKISQDEYEDEPVASNEFDDENQFDESVTSVSKSLTDAEEDFENDASIENDPDSFESPMHLENAGTINQQRSSDQIYRIFLITAPICLFLFIIGCLIVRRTPCIERLRSNIRLAFLFCCEAGKLLCTSPNKRPESSSSQATETISHHRSSYPAAMFDYGYSDYYVNDTVAQCQMTPTFYDGRGSMFSMTSDPDDRVFSRSKYDSYQHGESC